LLPEFSWGGDGGKECARLGAGDKRERELAVLAGAGLKANGGEGLEEQGAAVEGRGVPGAPQM
jgi:hypothetical protein